MIKAFTVLVLSLLVLVTSAMSVPRVRGVLMTPDEDAMLETASQQVENGESKKGQYLRARFEIPRSKPSDASLVWERKTTKNLNGYRAKTWRSLKRSECPRVIDARNANETASAREPEANVTMSDPSSAAPQENLDRGRALLNSGNVNDAIALLSNAASRDPKLHEAFNLLGVAYEAKGMRDRAFDVASEGSESR